MTPAAAPRNDREEIIEVIPSNHLLSIRDILIKYVRANKDISLCQRCELDNKCITTAKRTPVSQLRISVILFVVSTDSSVLYPIVVPAHWPNTDVLLDGRRIY
jgi:uncharacterized membrane protein